MPKIIIVTGTPGVGKTVVGRLLAKKIGFTFSSLGDLVRTERLHKGFDRKAGSYIIDEGSVRRKLQGYFEDYQKTGVVFETHSINSILPKTSGMVAIVLRLDPLVLANRLRVRNWPKLKIWMNVESEMIDVSLYDSLKVLGKTRVLEIDATRKRPEALVRGILKGLSRKKRWSLKSSPDWLKKYDPILLSRKIL
ncbi:MAG TPA: adenylate kinase family protein [Candidatus Angelobacter sp.]|nr:adenylate kinase family protein [Candidatus Angelobacter sp.]